MKIKVLILALLFSPLLMPAQTLTLEQCRQWAIETSPLTSQKDLIEQLKKTNMEIANNNWLPKAEINAQATYQSDVPGFASIHLPGITIEQLAKDQYKAMLDITQNLFDGKATSYQKTLQSTSAAVEGQRVEVDIQKLKEQVNAIFLNILFLDESIKVIELSRTDIENNLKRIQAMLANGTALQSDVDVLKTAILKTDQQHIESLANRRANIQALAVLTGYDMDENTVFEYPQPATTNTNESSERPELRLFDLQKTSLQNQSDLIRSKNIPKLAAFASGGYGRPTYNMLLNEFDWMYMVGLRLNVPLSNFYTTGKEREALNVQQRIIDKQRDNFTRNNQLQIKQQLVEIDKYESLIAKDSEIVSNRITIKEAAAGKLANGVITSTDFMEEMNAETQARLSQKMHEIQLIQAKLSYQSLLGR